VGARPYRCDGVSTSWIKIKNPAYTQAEGRHELFERGRHDERRFHRGARQRPVLALRPRLG
jgi:hypothetical protein